MSAARRVALAAACPVVARVSVAQATDPVVECEAQLGTCNYTFLHDGHCADGWIRGSNTLEQSLDACSQRCFENQECGFFAYDGALNGQRCSLYTERDDCPDDNRLPNFVSYEVRREWVLYAQLEVCSVAGIRNPFITLRGHSDLGSCQSAALNDPRCGPLLLSNGFACGCLSASQSSSFECVLESSGGSSTYILNASNYRFLHDGVCDAGWIQPNLVEDSLEACSQRCLEHRECGFIASNIGHICALYSRSGTCSDDDRFPSYNAYRINRGEWELRAPGLFCNNPADDLIDLGEGKTLAECLASALKDSLCGPLAITNAPRSPATCQCLRAGRQCELASGVYVFDATAGA